MSFLVLTNSLTGQTLNAGDYGYVGPNVSLAVDGVAVSFLGAANLTVGGTVFATLEAVYSHVANAVVTILASGSLVSAGQEACEIIDTSGRIYNAGLIQGAQSALFIGSADFRLVNTGQIFGNDATGVYGQNDGVWAISNSGHIAGREYGIYLNSDMIQLTGLGGTKIRNDGVIDGSVAALRLGGGNDDIVNRGSMQGDVYLNFGDDAYNGRLGAQAAVFGEAGLDTLIGGSGDEVLDGGTEDDQLSGGGGDDRVFGRDGNDRISGGDGDDVLAGDAGADLLAGGDGADRIAGGDGDDSLEGGVGFDLMQGGAGADQLRGGADDDALFGDLDADALWGGTGDDSLDGGDGNDRLEGGIGDDSLLGGVGADYLLGGAGADTLSGWISVDKLDGGLGDDILTGGSSADTFIFGRNAGNDRVTDFANDVDKLDLRAMDFASVAAVVAASSDSALGVLIDLKLVGGGTILLTGVVLSSLDATDLLI